MCSLKGRSPCAPTCYVGTISYTYLITGERASVTLPNGSGGAGGTWTYTYSVGDGSMSGYTPSTVPYSYGDGSAPYDPIFLGTGGDWLFGKAGDLNSLSPALTQITDDAGRIESIYLNGNGMPVPPT